MAKAGQTFPTLATKRLRLRQFEARDLQGLHACFGDRDAMRYWNFPACKTEAETEPKLQYSVTISGCSMPSRRSPKRERRRLGWKSI